jgi:hypothetical protein
MKSVQRNSTIRISLHCGQSHQQHLKAGTLIHVVDGEATVHEAPHWLAEKMVWIKRSLRDDENYTVMHSGWLSILATRTVIISIRPALTYRASARKYAVAFLRTLACNIARGA